MANTKKTEDAAPEVDVRPNAAATSVAADEPGVKFNHPDGSTILVTERELADLKAQGFVPESKKE
jgi:hypothetical protein